MRKLLIFVALLLIATAIIGSQYTAYKQSKAKSDKLQQLIDWDSDAESVPVVVPRKQINEMIMNQQRLIQALEGQQNAKQ